jgi:hypothetical protein
MNLPAAGESLGLHADAFLRAALLAQWRGPTGGKFEAAAMVIALGARSLARDGASIDRGSLALSP